MKKCEAQEVPGPPPVAVTNRFCNSQYTLDSHKERSQLASVKSWRLSILILLLLTVPFIFDQIWVHVWRVVPLSHDTTRLMGPVSKDGGINYVRALNQLARRGVTSKNDAAVLLIKAVGPKLFPAEAWYDKDILWQLDMQPFGTHASRLIPLADWLRKHPLTKNLNRYSRWHLELKLSGHPWTGTRYPVLAQWIQANREPLALFTRAVKRPRYYVPLESPDRGLIHARVPLLRPLSILVQVAAMRGMMLLGQGDAEGAVRWANRINRLALLVAQCPDVVSYLVGIRFESVAMRLDQAVANSKELSAKQLGALLDSIETLPSLPPLAEAINDQRYTGLSMIMMLDQNGLTILKINRMSESDKKLWNAVWPINYAGMMREENQIFDAEVAAAKAPGFLEECQRMAQLKMVINAYASPAKVILNPANVAVVLANPDATHIACYRRGVTVMRSLTEVAVALADFKTVHGKYPATLAALVPNYLKILPTDAFNGEPFQYAVTADDRGFQVRSLGLPPGVGGWTLRRDMAANSFVDGGNWASVAK